MNDIVKIITSVLSAIYKYLKLTTMRESWTKQRKRYEIRQNTRIDLANKRRDSVRKAKA